MSDREPHNDEAERILLGAILVDNRNLSVALENLDEADFYRNVHRKVFASMKDLADRSDRISLVTLESELIRAGNLEEVGGYFSLNYLLEGVPRGINAAQYARIVAEKATLRRLIRDADTVITETRGATGAQRVPPLTEGHVKGRRTEAEWFTPPSLFTALLGEGSKVKFDLDPCSPVEGPVPWVPARRFWTSDMDALADDWTGQGHVFMNPPYGNMTGPFLKRFMDHGDGIALVAARTDPDWFHEQATRADALLFLSTRLSYWERLCVHCVHGRSKHTSAAATGVEVGYCKARIGTEEGCDCKEFDPYPANNVRGYGPAGSPGSGQVLLASGEWALEILRGTIGLGWLVDQAKGRDHDALRDALTDLVEGLR